jgi:hypothetical protein
MPSTGFEPATPATNRPQTYALDRAATEVGLEDLEIEKKQIKYFKFVLNCVIDTISTERDACCSLVPLTTRL